MATKGEKQIYKEYLKGVTWAAKRQDLFRVRGKKCERCGSCTKIEVHHKTYENIFNEKMEDLEVLCWKCHRNHHLGKENVVIKPMPEISVPVRIRNKPYGTIPKDKPEIKIEETKPPIITLPIFLTNKKKAELIYPADLNPKDIQLLLACINRLRYK